jgi:hypothetical protein
MTGKTMIVVLWSYSEGCMENGFKGAAKLEFSPVITSKDLFLLHGDEEVYMVLVSY